jgi:hypothetical protein
MDEPDRPQLRQVLMHRADRNLQDRSDFSGALNF